MARTFPQKQKFHLYYFIFKYIAFFSQKIPISEIQISRFLYAKRVRFVIQFYFRIFKRISLFSQILSNLPIKKKRSHEVHLTRVGFIVVRILRRFVNVMNDE